MIQNNYKVKMQSSENDEREQLQSEEHKFSQKSSQEELIRVVKTDEDEVIDTEEKQQKKTAKQKRKLMMTQASEDNLNLQINRIGNFLNSASPHTPQIDSEINAIQEDDIQNDTLDVEVMSNMMLEKMKDTIHKRKNFWSSSEENSQALIDPLKRHQENGEAEAIAAIFMKQQKDRTAADYEEINNFMSKNVRLFKNNKGKPKTPRTPSESGRGDQGLSYEDSLKLYKVFMSKVYGPGETICEYGSFGDRFFIILSGSISVHQPIEMQLECDMLWDVYQIVIEKFESIRIFRDDVSKEIGHVVGLIGAPLLRQLAFKDVRKLIEFLRLLERQNIDQSIFYDYPTLDRKKIDSGQHRIGSLAKKLKTELYSEVNQSEDRDYDKKINVQMYVMEEVSQLTSGESFGQDSLLHESLLKRNATCKVMGDKVITAVLTKKDFRRVLYEQERQKTELKISKILSFDMFKGVPRRKMKNMYRLFYRSGTEESYKARRNEYLYRQTDPVNGIFCILSGQVKRVKEQWFINEKEAQGRHSNQKQSITQMQEATVRSSQQSLLGVVNELKRNKSKQIVITILQQGEILGVEEVLKGTSRRAYSIKVSSDVCEYLFLSTKNFCDKFYNNNLLPRSLLSDKMDQRTKFHGQLETQKTSFQVKNTEITDPIKKNETKQSKLDPPFTIKLIVNQSPNTKAAQESASRKLKETNRTSLKKPLTEVKRTEPEQIKSSRIPSPQARLERQISLEIRKSKPNIKKMVNQMKELRHSKIIDNKEQNRRDALRLKNLGSKSHHGKIMEQGVVKRFTLQEVEKKHKKDYDFSKKVSIEKVTEKLVLDAQGISSQWKSERKQDEHINLVVQSMTTDGRIQRSLKVFSEKLMPFLEYLKKQDLSYLRLLKVPKFSGSMLLDSRILRPQSKQPTRHKKHLSTISIKSKDRSESAKEKGRRETTQSANIISKRRQTLFQPQRMSHESLLQPEQIESQRHTRKSSFQQQFEKRKMDSSLVEQQEKKESKKPKELDLIKVFNEWLLGYDRMMVNKKTLPKERQNRSAELFAERIKSNASRLIKSPDDVRSHKIASRTNFNFKLPEDNSNLDSQRGKIQSEYAKWNYRDVENLKQQNTATQATLGTPNKITEIVKTDNSDIVLLDSERINRSQAHDWLKDPNKLGRMPTNISSITVPILEEKQPEAKIKTGRTENINEHHELLISPKRSSFSPEKGKFIVNIQQYQAQTKKIVLQKSLTTHTSFLESAKQPLDSQRKESQTQETVSQVELKQKLQNQPASILKQNKEVQTKSPAGKVLKKWASLINEETHVKTSINTLERHQGAQTNMTEIDDENIFNFNYKKHKSSIDDDDLQIPTSSAIHVALSPSKWQYKDFMQSSSIAVGLTEGTRSCSNLRSRLEGSAIKTIDFNMQILPKYYRHQQLNSFATVKQHEKDGIRVVKLPDNSTQQQYGKIFKLIPGSKVALTEKQPSVTKQRLKVSQNPWISPLEERKMFKRSRLSGHNYSSMVDVDQQIKELSKQHQRKGSRIKSRQHMNSMENYNMTVFGSQPRLSEADKQFQSQLIKDFDLTKNKQFSTHPHQQVNTAATENQNREQKATKISTANMSHSNSMHQIVTDQWQTAKVTDYNKKHQNSLQILNKDRMDKNSILKPSPLMVKIQASNLKPIRPSSVVNQKQANRLDTIDTQKQAEKEAISTERDTLTHVPSTGVIVEKVRHPTKLKSNKILKGLQVESKEYQRFTDKVLLKMQQKQKKEANNALLLKHKPSQNQLLFNNSVLKNQQSNGLLSRQSNISNSNIVRRSHSNHYLNDFAIRKTQIRINQAAMKKKMEQDNREVLVSRNAASGVTEANFE